MAVNITPIFSKVGDIQWATVITTANTAMDGTGTVLTAFTADATNGGFVSRVLCRPAGTNVASVIRVWINNGSTNATAGNNTLLSDVSLPATTASNSSALTPVDIPVNVAMPPGYKLNITIGTTVSAGWLVAAVGGKY